MKLVHNLSYRLSLLILLFCSLQSSIAQEFTFFDTFSAISYANSDGTEAWATNWIETGDDGSADNPGDFNDRRIYVNNGEINFRINELVFIDLDGATLTRDLDLSIYSTVNLTLDFDARFSGTESLLVQLFNNTTGLYETIGTFSAGFGTFTHALTADQISANSSIRFIGADNNWANNVAVFIDDVQFTAYRGLVSINDVTVSEADGTATFTATYDGGLGAVTVDYTTVDNTAYADSDYTTTSATLSFGPGPGSQTITVPIIDNLIGENNETFFITLSNPSDPLLFLVNGTGTITDDGDPAVNDEVPLVLFDEFDGNFDYAVAGSSLRTQDDATDPCAITATGSSILTSTIPAGSTIERAYLYWSHSGTSADDVVTFEGQQVTADIVNSALGGFFFGMVSDVTSIVSGLADPSGNTYDFTDLTVDNSATYCGTLVMGGWSVFIFYTNPTLVGSTINLYSGYKSEQNTATPQSFLLDGFFANGSAGSKTTILSFEGDIPLANDELLTVTPTSTGIAVPLTGDGDNDGVIRNNPFNSTVYDGTTGVNRTTEYGLDLDTYDVSGIIPAGETSFTTDIDVGDDRVFLNAVILKVPSNLITGTVYEDINYPGNNGRDLATSSGVPIENATLELYREATPGNFVLENTTTTNSAGEYVFAGMLNGNFKIRVVNSTVNSTRGGGLACTTCFAVQTFRKNYDGTSFIDITTEIGGASPSTEDTAAVTTIGNPLDAGAQSVSDVVINNSGITTIDFGFNFNTIVNSNESGQGSLEQFIINANNLDETGLDIAAHPNDGSLDPAAGDDTSIFMIPPTGDPFGRTPDAGYITADGYFDISMSTNLTPISSANTKIDGRTQTAYSGDSNTGTITPTVATTGTSAGALPTYELPEIQVRRNTGSGYVFDLRADNLTVRNIAAYGNDNFADGIRITSGSDIIATSNLLGVNALGIASGNTRHGIRVNQGSSVIDGNYIAQNRVNGILINDNVIVNISNNYITDNGADCNHNISILGGVGASIQNNLIENAGAFGINDQVGDSTITENTISTSGQDLTSCTNNSGIRLNVDNTSITNNIINANGGSGIRLTGGNTSGNRISQNAIFANGTTAPALGIDIDNDGVTTNDINDLDTGANGSLNFPIFESAAISGNDLIVVGWVGAGAIVEFFLSDIDTGDASVGDNTVDGPSPITISQDYGEGAVYLGAATEGSIDDNDISISAYPADVDGNEDTTNRFSFIIPLGSSIPVGSIITATATVANSTSEFGTVYTAGGASVITNRRTTYRVNPN